MSHSSRNIDGTLPLTIAVPGATQGYTPRCAGSSGARRKIKTWSNLEKLTSASELCEGGLAVVMPDIKITHVNDDESMGKGIGELAGEVDARHVHHGLTVAGDGFKVLARDGVDRARRAV
ncbi:hypothetical protein PG989_002482 [Apiospora arundinis]